MHRSSTTSRLVTGRKSLGCIHVQAVYPFIYNKQKPKCHEENQSKTDKVRTLILARSNNLNLKHLNDEFVSYKHAAFHFTRH